MFYSLYKHPLGGVGSFADWGAYNREGSWISLSDDTWCYIAILTCCEGN